MARVKLAGRKPQPPLELPKKKSPAKSKQRKLSKKKGPAPRASGIKRRRTAANIAKMNRKKKAEDRPIPKLKKLPTKADQMKVLRKQVKQHNDRACIRIPKGASVKDVEDILSKRPVVSKRPKKLTKEEREARRAARDKLEIQKAFELRNKEAENKKKQAKRMDDIIRRYTVAEKMAEDTAKKAGMVGSRENPMILQPRKTFTGNTVTKTKSGKKRIVLTAA